MIHALWKPMPGRFKDYIAMPKTNGYQSLHTTVIGPHGKPLEIQVRTHACTRPPSSASRRTGCTRTAAATRPDGLAARLSSTPLTSGDSEEFMDGLRGGLFDEEVYVFTPKGELKALPAGATPLDFAYSVHTDVGHRCVGAKVNGRIVPLHSTLSSGDIVEVLTSKAERGPSRDWLGIVTTTRARNKIRQWFAREQREDIEQRGRDALHSALKGNGLPHQKITSSPLLAAVIRDMGFKKAEDFYVAIGGGKVPVTQVTSKILHRLKTTRSSRSRRPSRSRAAARGRRRSSRPTTASSSTGCRRTTSSCAWPSAAPRCRATTSRATSPQAAASPSTVSTAPTGGPSCARPSASRP